MDFEVLGFQCIGDYLDAVLVKEERWGWWRQTAIQLTTPAGPRARVIWGWQIGAVEIWMESSNKSKTKEIIWMQGRCWFRQMRVATACNAAQGKKAIQGLNGSNFFWRDHQYQWLVQSRLSFNKIRVRQRFREAATTQTGVLDLDWSGLEVETYFCTHHKYATFQTGRLAFCFETICIRKEGPELCAAALLFRFVFLPPALYLLSNLPLCICIPDQFPPALLYPQHRPHLALQQD